MAEQDIGESLRIARREHALAVERHDATSAGMLERAIVDLQSRERVEDTAEETGDDDGGHRLFDQLVVRLPAPVELPHQRCREGVPQQSGEAP